MEFPEVYVDVLLIQLGLTDVTFDTFPQLPLFGDHKGSVKFLDCTFLAAF